MNLEALSSDLYQVIPLQVARSMHAVPFSQSDSHVDVAVLDPEDFTVLDDLRLALAPLSVIPHQAPENQIRAALDRWERFEARQSEDAAAAELADDETDSAEELDEQGRMARLVTQLLTQAVREGASDIHIEPTDTHMVVRFRIDGALTFHADYPRSIIPSVINRLKVMAGIDVAERRIPQDGRFARELDSRAVDCRVVTTPTTWNLEGAVIRLFDQSRSERSLDQMGFSPTLVERFTSLLSAPHGAILVTGPTGSGKTTTLYGALDVVARPDRKTLAIEDPVEIRLPSITQVQVNEKANLTFASALRSFLRADPDVILVGEVRDPETAALAAQAALTGHLVLSTLHTNQAVGAVTRLADLGLASYVTSSALRGVLAQRLVRRLCTHCKEEYTPEPAELEKASWPADWSVERLFRAHPGGCLECNRLGFKGRLAVGELVVITPEFAAAVNASAPEAELARIAEEGGTIPIHQDALSQVLAGVTSLAELERMGV